MSSFRLKQFRSPARIIGISSFIFLSNDFIMAFVSFVFVKPGSIYIPINWYILRHGLKWEGW